MGKPDARIAALRDVLTRGLRDIALRLSQMDLSTEAEPGEEQVKQFVLNVKRELDLARERGVVLVPNTAVYANPVMLRAANALALSSLRLRLDDGTEVLLSPPPDGHVLGTLEQEIDAAFAESLATDAPPAGVSS